MNSLDRPAPISAICFIWALMTVFQLYQFSSFIGKVAAIDVILVVGLATASLVAIAGIWQMKKWGLMLFVATFITNQVAALVLGQWHVNTLLLPLLVVGVGVAHMKQFR